MQPLQDSVAYHATISLPCALGDNVLLFQSCSCRQKYKQLLLEASLLNSMDAAFRVRKHCRVWRDAFGCVENISACLTAWWE